MDIIGRIDHWGRIAPDRIAHVSDGHRLTYGELLARSDALAAELRRTLPAGSAPVLVRGHKEPEMLVAFLGVRKTGRPYIPIDVSLPKARVAQIAESSGCATVLTPADIATLAAHGDGASAPLPPASPGDPHYIIFTSGSTGTPKGVVITTGNLAAFLEWMLAEQRFTEGGEVFLNQAPFSFDLSVMDLYLSLVTGGTLFSLTKDTIASLKAVSAALAGSGVTTWVSTPSFAQLCLADPQFRADLLPALRRFLFCGETLPPFVAESLLDRFPAAAVWNTYGPTEATVAMTSILVDRAVLARTGALPVGFPMPGVTVTIAGEDGAAMPAGEPGEIIISGPNVSVGYLGRPDLTATAFAEKDGGRSYRTGDWGHLDADGLLFVTGRMDGQIKLAGYRIELGDIEANLRELPGVGDAIVLPVLKNGRPELLAAFVVATAREGRSDLELLLALRGALAGRVPAYMVPKKFVFLDALPMTPNGKADRKKLAELL